MSQQDFSGDGFSQGMDMSGYPAASSNSGNAGAMNSGTQQQQFQGHTSNFGSPAPPTNANPAPGGDNWFTGGAGGGGGSGGGGDPSFGAPQQQPMSGGGGGGGMFSTPMYDTHSYGDNSGSMGGGGSLGGATVFDEPPLLEELGINFQHIWTKTSSVLVPTKTIDQHILDDTDLAGPLVFSLVQGFFLMLSGKLHFGYLFGFGLVGCTALHFVLNLMSQNTNVDIYRVVSVLGYCLLPIVILSSFTVIFSLRNVVGTILTLVAIVWCTHTATRFFEVVLSMREQRYLIAYPVLLLYACFALITIF